MFYIRKETIAIWLEEMMRAVFILYFVYYGSDLTKLFMPNSELSTRTAHLLNGPGLFSRQKINYMS